MVENEIGYVSNRRPIPKRKLPVCNFFSIICSMVQAPSVLVSSLATLDQSPI